MESLVIHRLNFEQMVISSFNRSNYTHLHKCIEYDQKLLVLYDQALALDNNALFLRKQQEKVSASVSEGIYFLENAGIILESSKLG